MAVAGWTHQELAASGGSLGPCILGPQDSLPGGKAAGSVPLAAPHFLISGGRRMISRALRIVRIFHRLKQTDLAEKLQISNSYLSEIESGIKSPTIELLGKYSTIFRIPVSTLLLFSERLDKKKFSERVRVQAGDKILRMLEWVAESEHFERGKATNTPS